MQHPYLREGMAEERIARLLAEARQARRGRSLRAVGAVLVAAGERLGAERRSERVEAGVGRLREAA